MDMQNFIQNLPRTMRFMRKMPLILTGLIIPILPGMAEPPAGYELVWADEFDYTGAPDPAKWTHEIGGGGWGNNEKQVYTDSLDNSRADGEKLIIEVQQDNEGRTPNYTSARLVTRGMGEWKYGRIEARAKMPTATGTWSAIWMLAAEDIYGDNYWPDNGEIDILEHVGYEEDPLFKAIKNDPQLPNVHSTLHTIKRNHLSGQGIGESTFVPDATSAFHVYGMTWTEDKLEFDVNGVVYHTVLKEDVVPQRNPPDDPWEFWPFKEKFYLILNIAIGGNWGGHFNSTIYPEDSPYGTNGIDHDAVWPQRMEVDYIRVYQQTEAPLTWKGLPMEANGDVETNSWMGRINVNTAPWIYSYKLGNFMRPEAAFEETFHTDSQWIYIPRR